MSESEEGTEAAVPVLYGESIRRAGFWHAGGAIGSTGVRASPAARREPQGSSASMEVGAQAAHLCQRPLLRVGRGSLPRCERLFIILFRVHVSPPRDGKHVQKHNSQDSSRKIPHVRQRLRAAARPPAEGGHSKNMRGSRDQRISFGPMRHARVFNTPVYYFSISPNT